MYSVLAQARRHHRRADDRRRLRPAGRGRRRGDWRSDQPLAARVHDRCWRCSSRSASGGTSWCCWPTARSSIGGFSGSTAPYLLDQMIGVVDRVDADRVHVLRNQPRDAAEVRHGLARPDDSVSALRHLPVSVPGAPEARAAAVRQRCWSTIVRCWSASRCGSAAVVVLVYYVRLECEMPAERARGPHHPVERATDRAGGRRPDQRRHRCSTTYARVMDLAGYRETLDPAGQTLLKLNLSWTQVFSGVLDRAVAGRRRRHASC